MDEIVDALLSMNKRLSSIDSKLDSLQPIAERLSNVDRSLASLSSLHGSTTPLEQVLEQQIKITELKDQQIQQLTEVIKALVERIAA